MFRYRSINGSVVAVSLFSLLLSAQPSFPISPDAFSAIGAGARACGLGGAFVGVADDEGASYWNPAGLAFLESPALSLTDRVMSIDTNYIVFSGALPISEWGAFGINLIFHGVDGVRGYDASAKPTGEGNCGEAMGSMAYAYEVAGLAVGIGLRGMYQSISFEGDSSESWGVGLSLGLLYDITDNLRIGIAVKDRMKVRDLRDESSYSVETPFSVTSGLYCSFGIGEGHRWGFMFDLEQRRGLPLKAHLGAELSLYGGALALRGGLDDLYLCLLYTSPSPRDRG